MKSPYSYGHVRFFLEQNAEKQATPAPSTAPASNPDATKELLSTVANSKLPTEQKNNLIERLEHQANFSILVSQAMSALKSGVPTEQVVAIFEKHMGTSKNAREFAQSVIAIYEDSKKGLNTLSTVHSVVKGLRGKFEESLNFNDALDILLKHPEDFKNFNKNNTNVRSVRTDDGTDESADFKAALEKHGYITRARYVFGNDNFYSRSELSAILELRDAIKTPEVNTLLKEGTNIQRSVRVETNADKIKNLSEADRARNQLAQLVDFSHDGMLTSMNTKKYSDTFVFAAFQKLFGGGKDAQLHIATELAMYANLSKRVNSQADLVAVISKVTGGDAKDIAAKLADPKKFALLVKEFQRSFLTEAAQTTPEVAAKLDTQKARDYKNERAKEQANTIEFIKSALVKEGLPNRVSSQLKEAGFADLDAKTMDELLARTAFQISINPRFFSSVGASTKVTDTTINTKTYTTTADTKINQPYPTTIIADPRSNANVNTHTFTQYVKDVVITKNQSSVVAAGNKSEVGATQQTTLTKNAPINPLTPALTGDQKGTTTKRELTSEENEKKRETKITPNIVIGFNVGAMQVEGKGYSAEAGVGASMVGSADGVIFPITISGRADVTTSNNNATLQSSNLKGNFTIGGELAVTGNTGNGAIPSIGFNVNPNNVKDTIKEQRVAIKEMWPLIRLTEDGRLDDTKISARLAEIEKQANAAKPVDEALLVEVSVMRKMIAETKAVVDANPDIREKKLIILRDTAAFEQVYAAAVHDSLKGFHVAGMNITLIPMIHAIFLGVNFQHVNQSASKNKDVDATERKVLKSETSDLSKTEVIKKFVTGYDPKNESITLRSAADVKSGLIVLDSVKLTEVNGIAQVIPTPGNSLRVESKSFMSGEGIAMYGIVIKEVKGVPQIKSATETTQEVGPEDKAGTFENIYKDGVLSQQARNKIFSLSRTNSHLISALNSIAKREYGAAEKQIAAGGKSLAFLKASLDKCNPGDKDEILENILLATLGGRNIRAKKNISYAEALAEHNRNKKAFNRILGVDKADQKEFLKAYEEHDKAIMAHKNGKETLVRGSLADAFTRDGNGPFRNISGSITLAQLDTSGKTTVRGLAYFSGDLDVVNKVSATENRVLQSYILKIAKNSGEFEKNRVATNALLPKDVAGFDSAEYEAYLLSNTIPTRLSGIVENGPKALFVTARAMVQGAVCINDVYALGYPVMKIKGKHVEPAPVIAKPAFSIAEEYNGDVYTNESSTSEATFGINYKREVVEQAISKTIEKSKITTTPGEREETVNDGTEGGTTKTPGGQNTGGPGTFPKK
ncbi:MAG: hypothetical protein ACOYN2_02835 [Patescibacteria group bacterium]